MTSTEKAANQHYRGVFNEDKEGGGGGGGCCMAVSGSRESTPSCTSSFGEDSRVNSRVCCLSGSPVRVQHKVSP